MEKERHIIIDIPEAQLDFTNPAWKAAVRDDFQELQNTLESKPTPGSPAYYTWFWFFMKYGRALSSKEGQAYLLKNGLTPFTFVKDILGLSMSGGGAYTIGYKFFEECLKYSTCIDVSGMTFNVKEPRKAMSSSWPRQQIFYGAPGTGKSKTVKDVTEAQPKDNVFRTTFHPDSDYSTFVGCYKPSKGKVKVYGPQGVVQVNGQDVEKDEITYTFVPQAFIKAYVRAWNTDDPVFLVIEEINRGNCAQIFGDMFQLLDRDVVTGESDYSIKPDTDLQQYLQSVMADAHTDKEEIKSGEEMSLPSNLYIWATMNTSDQSLFPIDSAFKRRWDWKYIPIADAGKGYKIDVAGITYDWWDFLEKINAEIGTVTSSEDKKLGYFFCKAKDGVVDAEMFVGKVVFYLWNEVFKDFQVDSDILSDGKDGTLAFKDFFLPDGSVNADTVKLFLDNLKVQPLSNGKEETDGGSGEEASADGFQ